MREKLSDMRDDPASDSNASESCGECEGGWKLAMRGSADSMSSVETERLCSRKNCPVDAEVSLGAQVSPDRGMLRAISSRIASGEKTYEGLAESSFTSKASSSSKSER